VSLIFDRWVPCSRCHKAYDDCTCPPDPEITPTNFDELEPELKDGESILGGPIEVDLVVGRCFTKLRDKLRR
jgi:hypothetical protein